MKTKIEIKNRWTGKILFEFETENNSVRKTVEKAIKSKADLSEADLSKADLSEADLSWADLSKADLSKADLSWADLSWADLSKADLSWADLSWADLSKANLSKADLSKADLSIIRNDMFIVLLHGLKEIDFLRQNIIDGKIDGSTYKGECACLSGTLMNGAIAQNGEDQPKFEKLVMDCRDSTRPIEMFFLGINIGDTPETSRFSALALQWIDEFKALIGS